MKKVMVILSMVLLVILIGLTVYFTNSSHEPTSTGRVVQEHSRGKEVLFGIDSPRTKDVSQILSSDEMITKLPSNALISISFYRYDNTQDKRIVTQRYTVEGQNVKKGKSGESDLEAFVHEKYVSGITNLCDTLQKANKNGDFELVLYMPEWKLLWKYKKLLAYKHCLG